MPMTVTQTIENMPPVAKGRAMEEITPSASDGSANLLFNALLYPNRSLPNHGFYVVMAVLICFHIIAAIMYLTSGAWPVLFFAGADIVAVWVAFKLSYRQGRLHERILLSAEELWVCRVLPSGHETRWKLVPFWTRVEMERPVQHESQLRLSSHGKTLVVGAFLSPAERGELAEALTAALATAKNAGIPSQTSG